MIGRKDRLRNLLLGRWRRVLAGGLLFPEGPAFDASGALWCVELRGGCLARIASGRVSRARTGGAPNGLAFDERGDAIFCDAERNAICRLPAREAARVAPGCDTEVSVEVIVDTVDGVPLSRPNDLAFDSAGNLLFTCPGAWADRFEPRGYVCCLGTDGRVARCGEGMCFPNGLVLTDGGRSLVVAETARHRLWKGSWDPLERSWGDARPWVDVGGPLGPDGLAQDASGRVYVAVAGSGRIKVVGPAGLVVQSHAAGGDQPTNVAFDPSGRLGLVVTEASSGRMLSLPRLGPGCPLFAGRAGTCASGSG